MKRNDALASWDKIHSCLESIFRDITGMGYRRRGDALTQLCYPYAEGHIGSINAIGIDNTVKCLEVDNASDPIRTDVVGRRSFRWSIRVFSDGGCPSQSLDRLRMKMQSEQMQSKLCAANISLSDSGTVTDVAPMPNAKLFMASVDIGFETFISETECDTVAIEKINFSGTIQRAAGTTPIETTGEVTP